MIKFAKCHTCKRRYNDDYCLYCTAHYDMSRLSDRDKAELKNYYSFDVNLEKNVTS